MVLALVARDSATRSTPTNTSHRVEAAAAEPHRNEGGSRAAGGAVLGFEGPLEASPLVTPSLMRSPSRIQVP